MKDPIGQRELADPSSPFPIQGHTGGGPYRGGRVVQSALIRFNWNTFRFRPLPAG
jgi:hypothetical protein